MNECVRHVVGGSFRSFRSRRSATLPFPITFGGGCASLLGRGGNLSRSLGFASPETRCLRHGRILGGLKNLLKANYFIILTAQGSSGSRGWNRLRLPQFRSGASSRDARVAIRDSAALVRWSPRRVRDLKRRGVSSPLRRGNT